MCILRLIFPNRVWYNGYNYSSYKPYTQLPKEAQNELKRLMGVKRFTYSVSPFCYKDDDGTYKYSLGYSVPGDYGSLPPFNFGDDRYPGLHNTLHKAYEDGEDEYLGWVVI